MLEEQDEELFVELEGAGELAQDLPHAVEEEQEHGCLAPLPAASIG